MSLAEHFRKLERGPGRRRRLTGTARKLRDGPGIAGIRTARHSDGAHLGRHGIADLPLVPPQAALFRRLTLRETLGLRSHLNPLCRMLNPERATARVQGLAKAMGCAVNVVDQPELCDMTTPAIVDRDPIIMAIGSEGTAPVLTRDIKTRLERTLPQNLGGLAALAGRLRRSFEAHVPRAQRRALWAWVFKGAPRDLWVRGAEREAARKIKSAIAAGKAPQAAAQGCVSLVGAGPVARDLMTLRAVERLQEADIIFYDRLVDSEVLELARRDAERVFVGKHIGAHGWPQPRINRMIVAEALKGRRVVRLKSGDPAIFGRASEEIEAAKAADVPVELVPGVTTASAAASALGQSLTERGIANTLVLATGTGHEKDPMPDCTRLCGPGTTTAFYMSVGQAARISDALMRQGLPARTPIRIAVQLSKSGQRLLTTEVARLAETLAQQAITGCAVLLLTWPEKQDAHVGLPFTCASAPAVPRV